MSERNLQLVAGSLPEGFGFTTLQALYNKFFELGVAKLPGDISYIIRSTTSPGADDRDKMWAQVDSYGNLIRVFSWSTAYGIWVSPHPIPASDKRILMFSGTTAQIDTLDGGVAGGVSPTSGPFWQIRSSMAQRMPVGVGTLPGSGLALAVNDNGGSDQVTLTEAQLPAHTHKMEFYHGTDSAGSGNPKDVFDYPGTPDNSSAFTNSTGDGDPFNNMPPYEAVYFIERTARLYHTST